MRGWPRSRSSSATSATGRIGLGFVAGSGLTSGALGSSVAHDAHNLVVIGMTDEDMAFAVQHLAAIGGGIVVVDGGRVVAECPLPVAGLLSDAPLAEVIEQSTATNHAAADLGWTGATPFLTMAFLALSVIPSLKITDRGLVDVDRFEIVPLVARPEGVMRASRAAAHDGDPHRADVRRRPARAAALARALPPGRLDPIELHAGDRARGPDRLGEHGHGHDGADGDRDGAARRDRRGAPVPPGRGRGRRGAARQALPDARRRGAVRDRPGADDRGRARRGPPARSHGLPRRRLRATAARRPDGARPARRRGCPPRGASS